MNETLKRNVKILILLLKLAHISSGSSQPEELPKGARRSIEVINQAELRRTNSNSNLNFKPPLQFQSQDALPEVPISRRTERKFEPMINRRTDYSTSFGQLNPNGKILQQPAYDRSISQSAWIAVLRSAPAPASSSSSSSYSRRVLESDDDELFSRSAVEENGNVVGDCVEKRISAPVKQAKRK